MFYSKTEFNYYNMTRARNINPIFKTTIIVWETKIGKCEYCSSFNRHIWQTMSGKSCHSMWVTYLISTIKFPLINNCSSLNISLVDRSWSKNKKYSKLLKEKCFFTNTSMPGKRSLRNNRLLSEDTSSRGCCSQKKKMSKMLSIIRKHRASPVKWFSALE